MASKIKLNCYLCLILLTIQTTLSLPVVLNETTIDDNLNDNLSSPNKVEDYNEIDNELTNFESHLIKCSYKLQDKNENDNDNILKHSNEIEENNEIDHESTTFGSNNVEKNNEIESVLKDGKNNSLELPNKSEERNASDRESIGLEEDIFKPIPYGNDGLNYPNREEKNNEIEFELIDGNNTLDLVNKSEESTASDSELISFGNTNKLEENSEIYSKLVDDENKMWELLNKLEQRNARDKLQDKNENEHDVLRHSNEAEENNEIDSESTSFGSNKLNHTNKVVESNEIDSELEDGKNNSLDCLEKPVEHNASDCESVGLEKDIFKPRPYGNYELNYPNPEEKNNEFEFELIDGNNTLDLVNKSEENTASDSELISFGNKNKLEENSEMYGKLVEDGNNMWERLSEPEENNASDSETINLGKDILNHPKKLEISDIDSELQDGKNNTRTLDFLNKSEEESNSSDIELISFGNKNGLEQSTETYSKLVEDGNNMWELLSEPEESNASDSVSIDFEDIFKPRPYGNDGLNYPNRDEKGNEIEFELIDNEPIRLGKTVEAAQQTRENPKKTQRNPNIFWERYVYYPQTYAEIIF